MIFNREKSDPFAGLESDDIGASGLPAADAPPLRETYRGPSAGDFWEPCPKCRGTGSTRWGKCFKCKGAKGKAYKTSPEERAKRRQSAAMSKAAKIEAFKTEYPDVWRWMAGSTFPPAVQMMADLEKYGSLFDSRIEFARRMIQKRADAIAAREAAKQEAVATAPVVGDALAKAFEAAKAAQAEKRKGEAGSRKPVKLFFGKFSIAEARRYPGVLYVNGAGGDYYGKIVEGKLLKGRDCSAEVAAEVAEILKDPKAAAIRYGQRFGICCVCSRTLTDSKSIEAGIGPVCAENMGW